MFSVLPIRSNSGDEDEGFLGQGTKLLVVEIANLDICRHWSIDAPQQPSHARPWSGRAMQRLCLGLLEILSLSKNSPKSPPKSTPHVTFTGDTSQSHHIGHSR